jgi:hypothetical protein
VFVAGLERAVNGVLAVSHQGLTAVQGVARTFRVLLSSTFRVLELGRDAFRDRVVPELRRLCRSRGADFRSVDLRWGIRSEASLGNTSRGSSIARLSVQWAEHRAHETLRSWML